jgi:hypothetical protein
VRLYRLAAEKVQARGDGGVVSVAVLDVRMPGGEMGGDEADGRVPIVEANGNGALVSRDAL